MGPPRLGIYGSEVRQENEFQPERTAQLAIERKRITPDRLGRSSIRRGMRKHE